jgi:hypothetical protein
MAFTLSGLFIMPAIVQAAFISTSEGTVARMDVETLATVTEALENDFLTEKLAALGLDADEINARLDALTPEERQAVLADVDKIQSGGNGVVTVLIIILLVVLILKLLDKEIVIK